MAKDKQQRPGAYGHRVEVYLPCIDEDVDEEDVTFENIEEDDQGRDVLTFTCPSCGQSHKSKRYLR